MDEKGWLLVLSFLVFILFFPKTYMHGDAPGYIDMTRFYLGQYEGKLEPPTANCRTLRPLLPWISAIPYYFFPSKYTILAINSVISVASLFVLMRLGKSFGLSGKESFYSAFAMLFSKYYFNYGFTLFVYPLGILVFVLLLNGLAKKWLPERLGLLGLAGLLAIPTAVTGVLLPPFAYFLKKQWKSIVSYLGVILVIMLVYQLHTTATYGCNYFYEREMQYKVTSTRPLGLWILPGLFLSWLAVQHVPLTACMLLGFEKRSGLLRTGFFFTLVTSAALVIFWKEDGLRMFLSYLPFASMYAGKGIGKVVEWLSGKTRFAEPLVLGTIGVASVLLSAKWVWIFG